MRRALPVKTSLMAMSILALLPLLAVAAPTVGQNVEGVITNVDLHGEPRHITIQQADGQSVDVVVHVSATHISYQDTKDANVSPELSNLKPGMRVRAQYAGDKPTNQIDVLSSASASGTMIQRTDANADLRSEKTTGSSTTAAAASNEMKVRLLQVNKNRSEISADVAGQRRTFRVQDPKMLASVRTGDLVVVTVDNPNGATPTVTNVRSAGMSGRVTSVDQSTGRVTVNVNGQDQTFTLDRSKKMNLQTGDQIQFETEERAAGEKVITKIDKQ